MADIIAKFRKTISSFGQLKIVPPLDMGGNQIKGLADGTEAQDAITLAQLQNGASAAGALMADGSVKASAALDMDSHKVENVTDGCQQITVDQLPMGQLTGVIEESV